MTSSSPRGQLFPFENSAHTFRYQAPHHHRPNMPLPLQYRLSTRRGQLFPFENSKAVPTDSLTGKSSPATKRAHSQGPSLPTSTSFQSSAFLSFPGRHPAIHPSSFSSLPLLAIKTLACLNLARGRSPFRNPVEHTRDGEGVARGHPNPSRRRGAGRFQWRRRVVPWTATSGGWWIA
jgi:hypothetical protein